MANYEGRCRSNYFRLRDADAVARYRELCERFGLHLLLKEGDAPEEHAGHFGFYCEADGPGEGSYPTVYADEDEEENGEVEADLADELAPLLADGSTCVIVEVGYEKMRYLTGWAVAFTNRCDSARAIPDAVLAINLNDIIDRALDRWGGEVTEATY